MIEHNTPKLEERIAKVDKEIEFWTKLHDQYRKTANEYFKNVNSSILAKNELNLLKNIRDGKYVVLDLENMELLRTKWV